jgi:hypothetical protein
MASSTKNVKLGVCKVYLGGVDLGFTQGGVEVSVKTDTHKVEIDQFGKTTVNELIMARNVMAKIPLAETTLQNMVRTMPGATLVSDGVQASGTVTFAANPTATTTVTVGGQAFTFQAAKPTTAFQVQLGATQLATLTNFVTVFNRSMIQQSIGGLTATLNAAGTVVTIKAIDPGTAPNAVTLVAASGGTASGATLTGGVAETKARVDVNIGTSVDLLSVAQELRLHPTSRTDNDYAEDFTIFLAATAGALTFAYKVDTERVYSVEFNGYPDSNGKLFALGDPLA